MTCLQLHYVIWLVDGSRTWLDELISHKRSAAEALRGTEPVRAFDLWVECYETGYHREDAKELRRFEQTELKERWYQRLADAADDLERATDERVED